MQINSVSSNTFRGYYKIPNTPQNVEKLVYKFNVPSAGVDMESFLGGFKPGKIIPEVAKMYKMLRGQEMLAFEGISPFAKINWDLLLKSVADSNNSSVEWLNMNAQNYGINTAEFPGSDSIIVISTDKDNIDCLKYLRDRVYRLLSTPFNSIRDFIDRQKINRNIDSDLPEHLKTLERGKNFLENENNVFAQKVLRGKLKEVRNINELLNYMMSE